MKMAIETKVVPERGAPLLVFPNPHNPLEIKIPTFEGPLDLLLHLIRKKELDIHKVALAELTSSYLAYLELIDSVNLDYAGEFLETAATLVWLKSKHLLPQTPLVEEGEEENPEERLRRQLIEYQTFKEAAFLLSSFDMLGRDIFIRPDQETEVVKETTETPEVFEEISLFGLMQAFRQVMERPRKNVHVIETETYRTEDRIEELIQLLHLKPRYQFEEFFAEDYSLAMLIITFMSILEMVRLRLIQVEQSFALASIYCRTGDEFPQQVNLWYEQQQPLRAQNVA